MLFCSSAPSSIAPFECALLGLSACRARVRDDELRRSRWVSRTLKQRINLSPAPLPGRRWRASARMSQSEESGQQAFCVIAASQCTLGKFTQPLSLERALESLGPPQTPGGSVRRLVTVVPRQVDPCSKSVKCLFLAMTRVSTFESVAGYPCTGAERRPPARHAAGRLQWGGREATKGTPPTATSR